MARRAGIDEHQHIHSFARRLDSFAKSLSEKERRMLAAIIMRAMDPIERMRWRDVTYLLQPHEAAILSRLLSEEAEL